MTLPVSSGDTPTRAYTADAECMDCGAAACRGVKMEIVCESCLKDVGRRWTEERAKVVALEGVVAGLREQLANREKDARRWQAVAPMLRVRNFALSVADSPISAGPFRKTWLESKEPLTGLLPTVEAYADALVGVGERSSTDL